MQTYFRMLGHGRPYIWLAIASLAALLAYAVFSAISLMSVIPFLEILFSPPPAESLPEPELQNISSLSDLKSAFYGWLRQTIARRSRQEVLLYFSIGLMGAIFLKSLFRYVAAYLIAPVEQGIVRQIRTQSFTHLTRLDLPFFYGKKKGNLMALFSSDVQQVQEAVLGNLHALMREPLSLVALLAFMLALNWQLTLLVLALMPVTAFLINLIARSLKRKARLGQEALGELLGVIDEYATGIRVVKAFQREAFETSKYEQKNTAFTRLNISVRRRIELASPITEVVSVLVICMIILFAEQWISPMGKAEPGKLTAPEFITFIVLFSQFLAPIKALSNGFSKVQKGIASYERLEQFWQTQPEVLSRPGAVEAPPFSEQVTFEGVGFSYGDNPLLQDIHFCIPKGKIVALVGPSGAGKSTLADLLPRFYDPNAGKILMDGTDIRDLTLSSLRSQISIVTQEGILFHDTVAANIAYGDPAPDPGRILVAARIAHAHEFINEMPMGYDTVIGERGGRLSGGQRQRIALARALYRNAPILILDEATSNLDTESEFLVQDALNQLLQQRTALIIAHRLSTVQRADLILVMQDGRILERGNHAELMALGGLYHRMILLQEAQ